MTLRNQPMALSLYRQVCALGKGGAGASRATDLASQAGLADCLPVRGRSSVSTRSWRH